MSKSEKRRPNCADDAGLEKIAPNPLQRQGEEASKASPKIILIFDHPKRFQGFQWGAGRTPLSIAISIAKPLRGVHPHWTMTARPDLRAPSSVRRPRGGEVANATTAFTLNPKA